MGLVKDGVKQVNSHRNISFQTVASVLVEKRGGVARENSMRDGFTSSGRESPLQGSNTCSLGQKDAEASETEAEGMMALTWERAGMVEGPEERQDGISE